MTTNSINPQPYRLTLKDAVEIWLAHWDGVFQHTIAARYRVNPGRVNEVLKGHRFPEARAEAALVRRAA